MATDTFEIMAPAGSWESLHAALNAGANSIYFGVEQLNMRARAANNFTLKDLEKIAHICAEHNAKSYLTLNTILYDHDLNLMRKICDAAKAAGISAIIASDVAAMNYAKKISLEVHISTQANVTNIEAVEFYSQFADVVVLARELTLEQIKSICHEVQARDIRGPSGNLVGIELFVHGALCVAISGKCYMSLGTYNASANRGACLQNCRRSYRVIDEETGDELVLDNKYIMSPKDLCTIGFLDKLLDAGITVLKIEGRGRAPEYVDTVVRVYRQAALAWQQGTYSQENVPAWIEELSKVFNRGFWHGGYYLGKQLGEWSGGYGSQATTEKVYLGKVENYYTKSQIAQCKLETGELRSSDKILITGPTTGVVECTVSSIKVEDQQVDLAQKGDIITFPLAQKVRENDKLFKIIDATRGTGQHNTNAQH